MIIRCHGRVQWIHWAGLRNTLQSRPKKELLSVTEDYVYDLCGGFEGRSEAIRVTSNPCIPFKSTFVCNAVVFSEGKVVLLWET